MAEQDAPRLILQEQARRTLADEGRVLGGILLSDSFIVWTPEHVLMGAFDSGPLDTLCRGLHLGPLAVARTAVGGIEIVEARSIIRGAPDPCRRVGLQLPDGDSVAAAVLADGTWMGLVHSPLPHSIPPSGGSLTRPDGSRSRGLPRYRRRLASLDPSSGEIRYSREIYAEDSLVDERIHLTAFGRLLILSATRWPYNWARSTGSGIEPIALADSPATGPTVHVAGDQSTWVGMPVFALDSGFVRLHASLKTPRRVLVLLDGRTGSVVRIRDVQVPFGILSVDRALSRLLALRRTTGPEIVKYGWRWEREE